MDSQLASLFLESSAGRLRLHMSRIAKCVETLSEDQVWARGSDNENAVGNLMLHLGGNVRQWIIAGIGGKPDVRVRDREFSARGGIAPTELVERLQTIVEDACRILPGVGASQLAETVTIQNRTLTRLDAIYQVVDHFAQHTAQIIFATKMMTHADLAFYQRLAAPQEKP